MPKSEPKGDFLKDLVFTLGLLMISGAGDINLKILTF